MSGPLCYVGGQMVPADVPTIVPGDHGLLYGTGFFETFRTVNGYPHLWPFHARRLQNACERIGIRLPESFLVRNPGSLRQVIGELLGIHKLDDAVFRYTVTAGVPESGFGAEYHRPGEMLSLRPLSDHVREVRLHVLKTLRDQGEWIPRPKSLNCLNMLAGIRELTGRRIDPSDAGLFLTGEDRMVVEATWQNVAWVEGETVCYPDESLGAVSGTFLAWLRTTGIPAEPVRADLSRLVHADAMLLVNSVRGVTPVGSLHGADGTLLREGIPSVQNRVLSELVRLWNDELYKTGAGIGIFD